MRIDLTINPEGRKNAIERAREKQVLIPTLAQQKNPELIPEKIKEKLRGVGLWDVNSLNLFRITWKNEPIAEGGLYGGVNYLEIPPEISGVPARIIGLVGKWFPTGTHKVGATFGCLVPRLITGQFDPTREKAVWPSTGNYCRGGAYNSQLLGCESIAILPEGMSRERFEWLSRIAGEVIGTPGTESNVKEIFDKCWELRQTRDNVVIFNQFEELGNHLWHYEVTGNAMAEVLRGEMGPEDRFAGTVLTTGSAGTMGAGEFLKEIYPESRLAVGEALQCPTLLQNGYGDHRLEGIGDKHVPWIHNARNTDMVLGIDDNDVMAAVRLFNEEEGKRYLEKQGVSPKIIAKLDLLGVSGVANLAGAIKMAKYYELGGQDIIMTVFTDSMELYRSRLEEMQEKDGEFDAEAAAIAYHRNLQGLGTDFLEEMTYIGKKRIHQLKYFTWIEQQGRELDELNAQWYDYDNYWNEFRQQAEEIDRAINEFNRETGLL